MDLLIVGDADLACGPGITATFQGAVQRFQQEFLGRFFKDCGNVFLVLPFLLDSFLFEAAHPA